MGSHSDLHAASAASAPGVVLVTGATSGIGAAIAHDLARDHLVYAAGRDLDALDSLEAVDGITAVELNLTDFATLADFAAALPERDDGGLTGIVHSAALGTPGRPEEADLDEWRRQFDLNVTAAAELTRHLLPALRLAHGTVVFINSGSGLRASAQMAVYAATKHALKGYADALRAAEAGVVRVATVYPGRTATPMQEELKRYEGDEYLPEEILSPGTVAAAVRFALTAPADCQITDLQVRPRFEGR